MVQSYLRKFIVGMAIAFVFLHDSFSYALEDHIPIVVNGVDEEVTKNLKVPNIEKIRVTGTSTFTSHFRPGRKMISQHPFGKEKFEAKSVNSSQKEEKSIDGKYNKDYSRINSDFKPNNLNNPKMDFDGRIPFTSDYSAPKRHTPKHN